MDLLGAGLVPLAGGHSGETFLAEAAGERSVVRIYAGRGATRGANAPEVDAAVLRLVRGLVPVPEVLEVRRADPSAGTPGLLVTSHLPGRRLDEVLPGADDALAAALGAAVAAAVCRLAQMPMPRAGLFLDGELRIGPMPPAARDLPAWVDAHLSDTSLSQWSSSERAALARLAEEAQDLADRSTRVCLVHSDLNPKNLLVDPGTATVTGVLDWEFAHAGSPFSDLGNLLRFERRPAFAEAVLSGYAENVPDAPADLLDRARAADMWALVDLAARADDNPVARRAHDQLRAMARTGSFHISASL
jgi:aminoglycoside phosphotransferase (APT) family kinase protein